MYLPYSLYSSLDRDEYVITEEKTVEKEITRPIPLEPFSDSVTDGYLKEFEHCYHIRRRAPWSWCYLLDKYRENRPLITIKVKYTLTYGELTEKGLATLRKRLDIHKKNVSKYEKLLAEAE